MKDMVLVLPMVYEVNKKCSNGNKKKSQVEIKCTHQYINDIIDILLHHSKTAY